MFNIFHQQFEEPEPMEITTDNAPNLFMTNEFIAHGVGGYTVEVEPIAHVCILLIHVYITN